MRGLEVKLSSTMELEQRLERAGLPECEIDRASERLRMNYPTIREISNETAESLGLIKRSGDVASSVPEEMLDTADRFIHCSAGSISAGLSLV
jgi:hypothetical protein